MIIDEFNGIFVPLITPFSTAHLTINYEFICSHLEHLNRKGIHGVVVTALEGECATLSFEERLSIIQWVRKFRGNLKFIVHIGSPSFTEAASLARYAQDHDADAVLISLPVFNQSLSAVGVFEYYRLLLNQISCPVFIYRTMEAALDDELISRLLEYNYLCGIVDCSNRRQPLSVNRLHIIQHDEAGVRNAIDNGAGGVLSAIGNIFPEISVAVNHAIRQNSDPRYLEKRLQDYYRVINRFPKIAAIKFILYLLGNDEIRVRPPLVDLTIAQKKSIETELMKSGFLE